MCDTPGAPFLRFHSHYVGEAQIVTADGTVLARRLYEEGEGVLLARVTPGASDGVDPVPDRFWIPELPWWARWMWNFQNAHGEREYRRVKEARQFGWQQAGWETMEVAPD